MVRKKKGGKCIVVSTCVQMDDVGWGGIVKELNAPLQQINA